MTKKVEQCRATPKASKNNAQDVLKFGAFLLSKVTGPGNMPDATPVAAISAITCIKLSIPDLAILMFPLKKKANATDGLWWSPEKFEIHAAIVNNEIPKPREILNTQGAWYPDAVSFAALVTKADNENTKVPTNSAA